MATVTLSDDRVSGDVFTDSYTAASFADKNVGTGKSISVSGIAISGTDAGNYTFNSTATATADITARPLTISATGVNKQYDGTTLATVTLSDNRVSGDVFTDSYTSATFADKNVAVGKAVSVSGISISGTDASNYTFNTSASTTADITPRPLTVTATGVNKVYDGTTMATVNLSDNRVSGDVFTDSYISATFADKDVGTGKSISVSGISIGGADAGNYTLSNTTATASANITARPLTVSATGVNKVYDGTTAATVTLGDDRVSGDVFTDSYTTATFADKNVGTGKTVSVSGISISGADAGNYTVNTTASTAADITGRALTVSATGVNKVYDGTTAAIVTLSDNRVSGDVFTDSYTTANFADKNVANGKTVSVSGISISGTDAGNYTFNVTASTTADITVRSLTVSGTGVNKAYDGTTMATVTLNDNRVSGDLFTDSYASASFADKNVGTAKSVNVSGIAISGTDAGNYTLSNTSATTTADITARALTVTAAGASKVYDGTTAATVTLGDDRVSGDVFTTSYTTASFADKNVGTGKSINVSGISISGTDAGNYTFNTTVSTTANITARALTVSATGVNKVYDGTTTATVILSDDRVSGDMFTDSYTSASFADKTVGTGKAISVSGISISGTDAGNYTFNLTASTTANITTRALTVTAAGVNKQYDGTTSATVTLSDDRVSGDVFTDSYTSASFADKNVGTGKSVSVSGISISGADAGNYNLTNTTASATASITARNLTVTATGVDKVYDGTTTAAVVLTTNKVMGDVVTTAYASANFADKNVGTGKSLSVNGVSISGADAGNYNLTNTTASATANITARSLTVTATGVDKVYDGTMAATVTLTTNKVMGDTVTAAFTSASFANKNVGTGKAITVNGISIAGADAGNYNLTNSTASAAANITAKPVNMTGGRPFDGTALASFGILSVSNTIGADNVIVLSGVGNLAAAAVGIQPLTSVGSLALGGSDATNYTTSGATGTVVIGAWTLAGFYNPVTMGDWVLNTVKGGSTVPLKFNVYQGPGTTNERTDVGAIKPFVMQQVACSGGTYEDPIDLVTTGGTTLRYDATAHQFIQNWQTPKTPGFCYRVTMETLDGSKLYAFFKMK
jgi:hypothetical protein